MPATGFVVGGSNKLSERLDAPIMGQNGMSMTSAWESPNRNVPPTFCRKPSRITALSTKISVELAGKPHSIDSKLHTKCSYANTNHYSEYLKTGTFIPVRSRAGKSSSGWLDKKLEPSECKRIT